MGELYKKATCNVNERVGNDNCKFNFECQGDRKCIENKCMGQANCDRFLIKSILTQYSKASCHIDEDLNDGGKGICESVHECMGERSCTKNRCEGASNCERYVVKIHKSH